MSVYPGFSTARMDAIFALAVAGGGDGRSRSSSRRRAGRRGRHPRRRGCGDRRGMRRPDRRRDPGPGMAGRHSRASAARRAEGAPAGGAPPFFHHGLTTQDVVDTATMCLASSALHHLGDLSSDAASALRTIIARSGSMATRGPLVPATGRRHHGRLPCRLAGSTNSIAPPVDSSRPRRRCNSAA